MSRCQKYSAAEFVGKDMQRYTYMIETNAWTRDSDLADAVLFRGAIVAAWGYIETTLIELAIRSSHMSEYSQINARYPYKLDGRINYMRTVLKSVGPFAQFCTIGEQFLDRFEAAAELRHIMAHGKMQVLDGVDIHCRLQAQHRRSHHATPEPLRH